MKIVLIVLGVLFLIGVLIVGAVAVGGYFALKKGKEIIRSQQTTGGGDVSIKTPFGDVSTGGDAEKIAANMGVDVYPGSTPLAEGTASSSFGGISVMTAAFETTDSIDQVEQFYKDKFPSSSASASSDTKRGVIFTTPKGVVTITLLSVDGKTKINMGCVPGDAKTESGSSE